METVVVLWIVAVVAVVVGIAGTILPAVPGIGLVFAGLLAGAWANDFQRVGGWTIALLAIIAVVAIAIDLVAGLLGAKKFGASKLAMIGAAIGAVAGLLMGIVGVFIGPFIGAVIGELIHRGKMNEAGAAAKIGLGTWLGILVGTVAKLTLALLMIGIFVISYFS